MTNITAILTVKLNFPYWIPFFFFHDREIGLEKTLKWLSYFYFVDPASEAGREHYATRPKSRKESKHTMHAFEDTVVLVWNFTFVCGPLHSLEWKCICKLYARVDLTQYRCRSFSTLTFPLFHSEKEAGVGCSLCICFREDLLLHKAYRCIPPPLVVQHSPKIQMEFCTNAYNRIFKMALVLLH